MHLSVAAVILSLAAFAVSDTDVDKCAWGESYWCSDLQVAKTCGAIQHCKTTVWANQKLTQDDSDVCKFCQTIVTDVHAFIKEKKTEDDIARFLVSACNGIPSQTAADECKQLVTQYVPEIIDLITSQMTPQVVCSLLKLCSGLEDTVQHSSIELHRVLLTKVPAVSVGVKDTQLCTDCKKFMSDIRAWLTSKEYEQQVEKMIDDAVCSLFGSFESECKMLVAEFLPALLNATAQYYDPNMICQPFCSGSAPSQSFPDLSTLAYFKALTKPGSVESCMICKTVLGELQSLARDAKTQNTITAFLKLDVCAHTGSYNATCCSMIDRYAPSIFELVATFMDPNSRCAGFGFCPSQVLHAETPKEAESKKPASSGDVTIGPECVLCEFIMKELQSLLTDNATEAEIIAALDKVCSVMPASIKQPCLDFVNMYGPAIIALLQQELDPAQICTFLGMCTQSDNKLTPVAPVPVTKAGDPEMCLLCETVVQYIEAMVEQNATVTEIEAVVKKICNFLPDTMKKQCSDLIDEYGAQIVHFIASKYSPKEICTLLKLCTSTNAAESVRMVNLERPVSARRVGTSQCSYGPAYWCASQKNAEQCGAVDHCKRYVWKN